MSFSPSTPRPDAPIRVALGRGTPDDTGTLRFARQVISDGAPATYPVVATTEDGVVAAWTNGTSGQTVLREAATTSTPNGTSGGRSVN
jgi:hypothetical protein